MKKEHKIGDMHWTAMCFDINAKEFKPYNVLRYREDFVKQLKKKVTTKEEFAKKMRSEMMYYYWGKCEAEVVLSKKDDRIIMSPWVGPDDITLDVTDRADFDWVGFFEKKTSEFYKKDEVKIDIFDQLNYRWDEFIDYCWNFHHKWQRKKVEDNGDKKII